LSATPSFSAPNMPMMEAVYNLSMEETLLNIHDGLYGEVFWTGTNWKKVWTRDTAMSVQYSLSWLFPEQTLNSIKEKIIGGEEIPKIWEEDTGTGGSYPTSVDRVIMMIACWSLYESTGDEAVLELGYEVTKDTLEQDYHNVYDEASGLFKGETGGLDHRSKTYPDWMDEAEEDSIVNIGESKAGNVNIIYAQALNLMAKTGAILGKDEAEVADWQAKYEALKQTINDRLWLDHRGMYASWEYPEYMGSPVADKVDVIANGYALMFDIANEEQKQQIMENYPMVVYGADTVWPQKNGRRGAAIDHNRGVWPGWEAALMIGSKENGNYQVAEEVFKSCVRVAGMSLSNKELMNFQTGEGVGSDRQLWSIAATLAGYYRLLFGMNYSTEGVTFKPYVPAWMEGPYTLSNYVYRDAILNISVEGNGDTLESIIVNGEAQPLDYVLPTDASGTYDIQLVVSDSGKRSNYHFEADSFAVSPNMPVLNEAADGTLTWEEDSNLTYKLWTGSEYVSVEGGSYTPDRSVYGAYSLVATDEDGITSEMSKPIIISPEGSKYVYEAEDATYNASCFEATAEGFSGTGYVNDFLKNPTDMTFNVEVAEDGKYALTTIYNNYGNACEGQDGAMRSVIIDGVDVGTMAFPIVGFDFQRSGHVFVNLLKGTHEITFTYNPDDWYDTNMTTARGTEKNSVSYDTLTLQKVAELDTDRSALEAAKAEYASKDAQIYTPESWEKVVEAYEVACQITADATQAEIDDATAALNQALVELEELVYNVSDVVSEVVDYKTIKLTWAPYRKAIYYVVERFINEEWMEVGSVSEPTFIANGVKTGKTYTYRVKAVTAEGESGYSDEVSATPMLSGEVELTLVPNGTNKFDLSWSQVDGATRYIIYRKANEGEWQKLLTLGKDVTTYTTKAMNPGTYSYMIKAGRYDSTDRVMTNGSNVVEAVATNETPVITITSVAGEQITISWSSVAGMKGYDVYRATAIDGKYTQLKRTTSTSITTTIKAGKTYYYKVRGFDIVNDVKVYAAYSETVSYSVN
ncbi:MAG: CBM35 domain-containing protein, partial [Longicatena sp.]|nr:CBM35 domain-containing protein [Longicatena sp.]